MNGYNRKQYLYPNPEKWNYIPKYAETPFSEKLVIFAVIIMVIVIIAAFGPQLIGLIF